MQVCDKAKPRSKLV